MKNKYIGFQEFILPSRKTPIYIVYNIQTDEDLGVIKWWGAWRQYCFFPNKNTLYSIGCLIEINKFLEELKDEKTRTKKR